MKYMKHSFRKRNLLVNLIAIIGIFTMQFQVIIAQSCPPDNCPGQCTAGDVQGINYYFLDMDSIPLNSSCTLGEEIEVVLYVEFITTANSRYDLVAFGNVYSPQNFCNSHFEICLGDYENIQGSIYAPVDTFDWICGDEIQVLDSYFSWKVPDSDPDDCSLCSIQKSKCIRISESIPIETPLPIELMSFDIRKTGTTAIASWTTLTELNNDFFEIERSNNGKEFFSISGKIEGAGTNFTDNHYNWVDQNPLDGLNYYRLMQVDYDGKYTFSGVRSIYFEDSQSHINVFPNPAKEELSIITGKKNGEVTLRIIDFVGKVKSTQVYESGSWKSSMSIDISDLPEGIYLIDLIGDLQRETIRFVKG